MVKFGERVKQLRRSAGMTQGQLAERIWVSKAAVSNYELSERNPSPEIIIKVARVFGVSTDYLLGVENKRECTVDISGLPEEDIRFIQSAVTLLKKKNVKAKTKTVAER